MNDWQVPLTDIAMPEQDVQAVMECLESGWLTMGPRTQAFERALADYVGTPHAVTVSSGTAALHLACLAAGIGPGDEVIVPAFTFVASAAAVRYTGAEPVFCDVSGPRDFNIDPADAAARITPRTKAIVAVDLFGLPAPLDELADLGVPVLEDAAQAAGASLGDRRAGALADAATFSFYPSKNLGAFGDGGAIATDDDDVAALARALRFHGSRDKQSFEYVGYNSRLDEVQAAILRILLAELDDWCDRRRAAADAYAQAGIAEYVSPPAVPTGAKPAWHLYVVTHPKADDLIAGLKERGIGTRGYYRTPLHRQAAMSPYATDAPLPVTDALSRDNLALPMSPVLTSAQAGEVVAALAALAS
jgi:dTDP-4-amino-4,6-dideoxygalactose transaminase